MIRLWQGGVAELPRWIYQVLYGSPVGAPLWSGVEMSGYLVGSAAFKAVGTGDPRPAGSIPVHLRHSRVVLRPESAPGAALHAMSA